MQNILVYNRKNIIVYLIGFFFYQAVFTQISQKSPNFIVILTDDQSWVGTSFLVDPNDSRSKSDYYVTPNMKRLANMGMRMTNGYAPAPFCSPTRKSILTGLNPAKHEYQKDRDNWTKKFRKRLTIPKVLKMANPNYITAHFGKWDARYDDYTPEEMGYDYSDGLTGNNTGGGKQNFEINGLTKPYVLGKDWPESIDDPKLIYSLTNKAIDFIEEHSNKNPFFIQISHYAVHLAINHSKKSLENFKENEKGEKHFIPEFAAMTQDLDNGIGDLLNKIIELNILKNTYIIFLSDNGGRNSIPLGPKQIKPRNFPLRDGKGSMYEGGIRVPFVVVGPGVEMNSYTDIPVTGLDILPSLADLAGFEIKNLPKIIDGGSFRDLIHSKNEKIIKRNDPFLIFHHAANRKPESAIREKNYKLVKNWTDKSLELFDLSKDKEEENDLSSVYPKIVKDLETKLISFLNKAKAETKRTKY